MDAKKIVLLIVAGSIAAWWFLGDRKIPFVGESGKPPATTAQAPTGAGSAGSGTTVDKKDAPVAPQDAQEQACCCPSCPVEKPKVVTPPPPPPKPPCCCCRPAEKKAAAPPPPASPARNIAAENVNYFLAAGEKARERMRGATVPRVGGVEAGDVNAARSAEFQASVPKTHLGAGIGVLGVGEIGHHGKKEPTAGTGGPVDPPSK